MLKKINKLEYIRLIYWLKFHNIPYVFLFFYTLKLKNLYNSNKLNFIYLYNGRFWRIVYLNKWRVGLSLYSFNWFKQIAIYKKKQYLKKKKKK